MLIFGIAKLPSMGEKQNKDFWDKLTSVSSLISTVLLSAIIFVVTQYYQNRQQRIDAELKKTQLIENLLPYIGTGDSDKDKTVIIILSDLGYDSLACQIGQSVNSEGTRAAIKQLSNDSISLDKGKRKMYRDRWRQIKAEKD